MLKKINLRSSKNGFTLVEIIISVAILAFVSIVVLELFLTAVTLNQKASDLDKSVVLAKNAVEIFKASKRVNSYSKQNIGESILVKSYYDSNWNPITKEIATKQGYEYSLTASVKPSMDSLAKTSNVYDLEVSIWKKNKYLHDKNPKPLIYSLKASKLFDDI